MSRVFETDRRVYRAYIWFGMYAVSILWCISSSGSMATYIANVLLELRRNISGLVADVESQPPSASSTYTSPASQALIITVAAVGALHTAFVWVYFSQLGFPEPSIPRPKGIARRLRSCSVEHPSGYSDQCSTTVSNQSVDTDRFLTVSASHFHGRPYRHCEAYKCLRNLRLCD